MNISALKNTNSIESEASAFLSNPVEYFDGSLDAMHGLSRADLESLQLAALKQRFSLLRDHVPMLTKLADEQNLTSLSALNDVVPLLFRHTVYKSYPVALLEQNRFKQMTQWLNKLTTVDLSNVDTSQCQGIDDWIKALDEQSPLNLRHSSGTTGTVSFIPRTKEESDQHFFVSQHGIFQSVGRVPPTPRTPLSMEVIHGSYRSGSTSFLRNTENLVKYVCGGSESRFHSLYPHHQSADLMFLAGRLRAAQAKGTLDRLELNPAMLARKAEFETMQSKMATDMDSFYADAIQKLKGEKIYIMGPWSVLTNIATNGLKEGLENVFSPESMVLTSGGAKGTVLQDDWKDLVKQFFGVSHLIQFYAMSEVMSYNRLCSHGRYHIEPWAILFVLDPDTGELLPREGVQTGRSAFYDLQAKTYWGGFVSGDEVTVDWSSTCACGQLSPHLSTDISRYSEKRGGDDKISCAAASDAHESALTYLNEIDI